MQQRQVMTIAQSRSDLTRIPTSIVILRRDKLSKNLNLASQVHIEASDLVKFYIFKCDAEYYVTVKRTSPQRTDILSHLKF